MVISPTYDIGETPYFKCHRSKEVQYIQGEIVRISVYKSKDAYNIRYSIRYNLGGEVLQTDRWEEDLIREDLAGKEAQT